MDTPCCRGPYRCDGLVSWLLVGIALASDLDVWELGGVLWLQDHGCRLVGWKTLDDHLGLRIRQDGDLLWLHLFAVLVVRRGSFTSRLASWACRLTGLASGTACTQSSQLSLCLLHTSFT